eukprot:CAMPEP_0174854090 /NCGR_PEP_ID=MMETSP1114-20130205/29944_1 /TAXON_ID=312471 /ORGANISM="Neobodo designis, Strain CCAP 1951/1" /LENGTH=190 /DNA_ID=CAMNT_0016088763 /DNA_START=30 /DNA_END=602 /DNA_ORIENTATION=+
MSWEEAPSPEDIGRAGWTILHTTAAAFPNHPSASQQQDFRDFIRSWSRVYPCSVCSYHMRQELQRRDIVATNKREASRFVCELHNSVNSMLGKPEADCDPEKLLKRWHPGYPDAMEDEPTIEQQLAAARTSASRTESKPSGRWGSMFGDSSASPSKPVSDDDTDPASVLARLKGCQTWCPDKSIDTVVGK